MRESGRACSCLDRVGDSVFWGLATVLIWRTGTEPALRRTSEDGWRVAWEWPVTLAGSHLLLLPPIVTYAELMWGGSFFLGATLAATGLRPGLMAKGYLNWDAQHDSALLRRGTIGQVVMLATALALAIAAGWSRTSF